MLFRITGAEVFDSDHVFRKHDVFIRDGFFTEEPGDAAQFEVIDASGMKAVPGLTDIHLHGCMGRDFCEGSRDVIEHILRYEALNGITNICPAAMTLPEEKLLRIAGAARSYVEDNGTGLAGINLEGPFISFEKKGAQNPEYIREPDTLLFDRIMETSGGMVRLLSLAPELPGAMDFIDKNKDRVKISFAHSGADYDTAMEAFNRGVHHMTHIYNGMNAMNHRCPGPVFAAADNGNVEVEIICDGIHVHPAVVRSTLKLFGSDKVIFISDSMEAAGMPDGEYELGGLPVIKRGKKAALKDGTIAGSAVNLMDCVRCAVLDMGIPLETAIKCAAVNPAGSIGIYDRTGSIEAGKSAELLLLNGELGPEMVFNRGMMITGKQGFISCRHHRGIRE